jgi:hypothetical protein
MDVLRVTLAALVLGAAGSVAACSSDDSHDDDGHAGHAGTTSTACGGQGETFSAGMSKPGDNDALTFVLVSSDPTPPQRRDNVWVLELREGGQPVTGATIKVTTRMPVHGHPGAGTPTVTELGDGRYELDPVSLEMPDLWEVSIEVTTAEGTTDVARFTFCIA